MMPTHRRATPEQLEAERSAVVLAERYARATFTETLERLTGRLEQGAAVLRRLSHEDHVSVTERASGRAKS